MLYISSQDFFDKAVQCLCLSRDEEKQCAVLMKSGDSEARQKIINNYIPFVASYVKRYSGDKPSLQMIYRCLQALENQVDKFDFFQDRESFIHLLSWVLRQEITRYIAGI